MKPANFAPVYLGIYPPLAEIAREHGYALAAHGTMGRDFDLIAVPWTENAADPETVVEAMTTRHSLFRAGGAPSIREHGRIVYSIGVSFGECFVDLSFMPLISAAHPQGAPAAQEQEKPE